MGSKGSAAHALPLTVLEGVRCLECGATYSKPAFGGTVDKNPGCPVCGYVGWIPISPSSPLRHSGVAPLRLASLRLSK